MLRKEIRIQDWGRSGAEIKTRVLRARVLGTGGDQVGRLVLRR